MLATNMCYSGCSAEPEPIGGTRTRAEGCWAWSRGIKAKSQKQLTQIIKQQEKKILTVLDNLIFGGMQRFCRVLNSVALKNKHQDLRVK